MSTKTSGHLVNQGGIRGHSAGDIFPYIVVLVGSFVDGFKYHVIGNGFQAGEMVCGSYKHAHGCAVRLMAQDERYSHDIH